MGVCNCVYLGEVYILGRIGERAEAIPFLLSLREPAARTKHTPDACFTNLPTGKNNTLFQHM